MSRVEESLSLSGEQIAQALSEVRRLEAEEKEETERCEKLSDNIADITAKKDAAVSNCVNVTLSMTPNCYYTHSFDKY